MKISKHLHSCLLLEEQGKTVLIDPGKFTYDEKALNIDTIKQLDYLLITHEHADHFFLPFIKELLAKFPEAKIVTNESVEALLFKENLSARTKDDESIIVVPVNHERIFDVQAPPNVLFEVFDRLTHPGDSMSFTTTKEILALPLLGPSWMITQAVEKALELKPKAILPIHDYHWRDEYRLEYYQRLEKFFTGKGIEFYPIETGETIIL